MSNKDRIIEEQRRIIEQQCILIESLERRLNMLPLPISPYPVIPYPAQPWNPIWVKTGLTTSVDDWQGVRYLCGDPMPLDSTEDVTV